MKEKRFFIAFAIGLSVMLQSCAYSYYQLYHTESDAASVEDGTMVYENDDVRILFNLWGEYGQSDFLIFNKTDSNIFIDLRQSHLIINGIATTYFRNRVFTKKRSSTASVGRYQSYAVANTSSTENTSTGSATGAATSAKTTVRNDKSVSEVEQAIVCIPARAAKPFGGFSLNTNVYEDCDLEDSPSLKEDASVVFDKENSPLYFENAISYGFSLEQLKEVRYDFWVSKIANYKKEIFIDRVSIEKCGKQSSLSTYDYVPVFKNPSRFYIKYGTAED